MKRCSWVKNANELMINYHDQEWGKPVYDDQVLFEFLILEGAQAGLSWNTVLIKREAYRKTFKSFDVKKCSALKSSFLEKQMLNPGIIRNRLKIYSVPLNAKGFLQIQSEFGSFSNYLWAFSNHKVIKSKFKNSSEYPTRTELSDIISRDLKQRGFKFIGTTIIYAFLQAVGVVNDHCESCSFKS